MDRVAREADDRLGSVGAGEAVRAVERRARELAARFKEAMLQGIMDRSVERALGRARGERRRGWTRFRCPRCGLRRGDELRRNGHYRRRPLTVDGLIELRVPQLVCVTCGKGVPFEHPLLPRRRRLWLDVDQELTQLYLEGASYRGVKRLLERKARTSMGLMTLWRTFQAVGKGRHDVPARGQAEYLGLDEVYHRIKGKPHWFLTVRAQTKDGKKHYVGSVLSRDRSQKAWEEALEGLGISRYNPPFAVLTDGDAAIEEAVKKTLPGVAMRRCVWHVQHNAADWIRERHPGEEQEGLRRGLMAGVKEIVDAPTLEQREESLRVLASAAPWLTERLRMVLGRVPVKDGSNPVRTNNLLERGFRELRRRTRPMDGFKSDAGAANFHLVWMLKENARCNGRDYLSEIIP